MRLFVRLTVIVALGLLALSIIGFLLHIVVLAVVIAALAAGAIGIARYVRRRYLDRSGPVMVLPQRRW